MANARKTGQSAVNEDEMSISGSRAAIDINLDEFERRLRIAGTSPGYVEDPLSELARLVDEARPVASQVQQPKPRTEVVEPPPPVELRSSLDGSEAGPQQGSAESEAELFAAVSDYLPHQTAPSDFEGPAHSKKWLMSASALAVAGVVMFGGVFALKGGMPGLPKQPPFIAALSGPTKIKPPSEQAATTQNDAGAALLNDNAKPARVKIINSEEQPVDLRAEASVGAIAKPPVDSVPQTSDSAVKATVDTPVVVASGGTPPAMASQFPDPKPVRTVSLRPDGTPIPAASAVPALDAQPSPPVDEPPKAAAKTQQQKGSDAAGSPQPSTPKIDLPTKLSGKSSARVVVAKTDTTVPEGKEPVQLSSIPKAEKTKQAKTHEAAAEKPPTGTEQPGEPDSATKSSGWAVQLAAPSTESEAESAAQRLNAKYASALNGAIIGIHKAVVKGTIIYRLRVAGLSKAEAAALCARLKGEGGDCFIAR